MYTVCMHGKGKVDLIVDQQVGIIAAGQLSQIPGKGQKLSCRQVLLAQLNGLDATLESRLNGRHQGVPRGELVTVGNQVEVEVDGVGHFSHQVTKKALLF
jgi:hypothetical protein